MKLGLRQLGRAGAVLLPFALAACQTLIPPTTPCGPDGCPATICDPKVLTKPTVHAAAHDLDHLEKHIDWHGSVVAKVPDVWGQARLTLYREQFEGEMIKDLDAFKVNLQGAIARQDQAFLLNATALSATLETPVRPYRFRVLPAGRYFRGLDATTGLPYPTKDKDGNDTNIVVLDRNETVVVKPEELGTSPPQLPATVGVVKNANDTTSLTDINFFVDRSGLQFKNQFISPTGEKLSLALEPERYLEQKKRYLDLLAQIRRTNEGDDTADSPGYSLQLMRIPVSVLPGKHTDVGHGAEITMTLTPVLGDDLLPNTFRSLIINDLVDQLGFPLTKFLGEDEARALLTEKNRWIVRNLPVFAAIAAATTPEALSGELVKVPLPILEDMRADLLVDEADLKKLLDDAIAARTKPSEKMVERAAVTDAAKAYIDKANAAKTRQAGLSRLANSIRANQLIERTTARLGGLKTPFSPGTRNRQAMPSSQFLEVYGAAFAFEVAFKANQALGKQIKDAGYVHLPDVQAFLKQELDAAHQMLAREVNRDLLDEFCTSQLVNWIRTRQGAELLEQRSVYRERLKERTDRRPSSTYGIGDLDKDPKFTTTAALGWALIVDSALLTDRFIADMKSTASCRGVVLPHCGEWLDYYRPCPSPEARQTFNDYVRCRWPIHVFALDPAIQEQNLADRLATRRELQLALSLAFSHGFMNFNQLTRYARRLEAEYETIDLNRTQIGFAHGSDTFGWRFYPRYQTPDTPGNLTVIARDLIAGGPNKNQLLRERRLEPGPRECVALVIMPSFVPAVTLDTTSNFFGLANPKHKVFDHTQAVKLGRTVQAIKTAGCGLTDAHCYRNGDAARLVKRAEQLEARLPLQTVTFPVPTEDTVGGFELFSNNTTDLSPELYGFYGAPGLSSDSATTLFLVGDHFSPLRTHVIVGNKGLVKPAEPQSKDTNPPVLAVKKVTLLSRQVMQVEVETGALPMKGGEVASIHVATPYGVSREVTIPLVGTKPAAATPATPTEGYTLLTTEMTVQYSAVVDGAPVGRFVPSAPVVADSALALKWQDNSGSVPEKVKIRFDFTFQGKPLSVTTHDLGGGADGVFSLTGANLQQVGKDLTDQIVKSFGSLPDSPNPLNESLTATTVKVIPSGGGHALQSVAAKPALKVTFKAVPPK